MLDKGLFTRKVKVIYKTSWCESSHHIGITDSNINKSRHKRETCTWRTHPLLDTGADVVIFGFGVDVVIFGFGADVVIFGFGADVVIFGFGADVIILGSGADEVALKVV